ncbi:MAG TPA: alpha/beta fold hydrolase [Haliangiales bacterium]|nr:alpha/beta fold hydrolase [Haliangiales bacterium]
MKTVEFVEVDGVRLRVSIEGSGRGRPLLLINGIGAGLELFAPFRARLDGVETIAIDVPGAGGSPATALPRRLCGLARLLVRALDVLGFHKVDVLGISWGGTLAQELAFRHPDRVGRLVLVATSPGLISLPGRLEAILVLATPKRYYSPTYYEEVAPILYGGAARDRPELLREQGHLRFIRPPSLRGYLWQIAAVAGWTSFPWLHRLRLPVLVMAADDDPIIPLANARLMVWRLPDATLEVVPRGGHLFLATHAETVAPRIAAFLGAG